MRIMGALDVLHLGLLLASLLLLAGVLSSLVALRFGAPLLLVFLLVGMLAGESGLGLRFDDVRSTYVVGSVALALILFDGGLRTRLSTFRSVLAPSLTLATIGVVMTAALTAPFAKYALHLEWIESFLMGAVVASTDAAAVFFLVHSRGLRLRPRVGATLEVESGTNDPFAIFLTLILIQIILLGESSPTAIFSSLIEADIGGAVIGIAGGYAITFVLNRAALAQGLHAPFVAISALVVFALSETLHASGFLAVYLAGLIVGNQQTRAHSTLVVFLDAITWLAQIVMFVLLGLLASPDRLLDRIGPAVVVALALMLVARPLTVFVTLLPFRFSRREKLFISWVGLRGAVGIFLASIPLLVGLPHAQLYFDVGFVVVLISLLVQGWTVAIAAQRLHIALPRTDAAPRRVELDLPGQLAQELVGYPVRTNSPYLRRRLLPSWAKVMLVVRDEQVLTTAEADGVTEGDHVYLLAPTEKAQALDRFFVNLPAPTAPDPRLLGDFFVPGDTTLAALAEIYGLTIDPAETAVSITQYFIDRIGHRAHPGDTLPLGPIALVATKVIDGHVTTAGLRLAEPEPLPPRQRSRLRSRLRAWQRPLRRLLGKTRTRPRAKS
jgi:cell volume regulation protein A